MGAAALQKYIGSFGGIGAPGVGTSSSYTTKEMNKEIMPEKVKLLGSLINHVASVVQFLFYRCLS